ncbi:MAG: GNAT family N-acetyltransferase [Thermoprotei archaeon]
MIKVVTLDELDQDNFFENSTLLGVGFGDWTPATKLTKQKPWAYPARAEYGGLAALVDGVVTARLDVYRFPFRTASGDVQGSGIGGVVSLPDQSRKGAVKALFAEAHRKEKEAGSEISLLYTNMSWGAHRLYESIGYKDVAHFYRAVRRPSALYTAKPLDGYTLVKSDSSESDFFRHVHSEWFDGRTGFSRMGVPWRVHGKGWMKIMFEGDPIGYVKVEASAKGWHCLEAAYQRIDALRASVALLERQAGAKRLLTFGRPYVQYFSKLFPSESYLLVKTWSVLMGTPLAGSPYQYSLELGGEDRVSQMVLDAF